MTAAVGRIVIFILVAAALIWGGWRIALSRPDVQMALFNRAASHEFDAASLKSAPLDAITATACADGPCVLVEAGGRVFLVGAATGSADYLAATGRLSADLDGVLLNDLSRRSIGGLTDVRDASWEAGRRSPLTVYGPIGVDRVVDGVNAAVEASDAAQSVRFSSGLLPFDAAPLTARSTGPGDDGEMIFDSGVLTIRAYAASLSAAAEEVMYRFDFGGRTLIVAGCGARVEDLRRVGRDAASLAAILPVADPDLLEVRRLAALEAGLDRRSRFITAAGDACLTLQAAEAALSAAGVERALAAPLFPAARSDVSKRIWRREVEALEAVRAAPGWRGEQIVLPSRAGAS